MWRTVYVVVVSSVLLFGILLQLVGECCSGADCCDPQKKKSSEKSARLKQESKDDVKVVGDGRRVLMSYFVV